MTRTEAAEILDNLIGMVEDNQENDYDTAIKMAIKALNVSDREVGEWIVVERHEHYPSGKPYEQVQCPFCKRFDNNGDGSFCGYCGARMRERRRR